MCLIHRQRLTHNSGWPADACGNQFGLSLCPVRLFLLMHRISENCLLSSMLKLPHYFIDFLFEIRLTKINISCRLYECYTFLMIGKGRVWKRA